MDLGNREWYHRSAGAKTTGKNFKQKNAKKKRKNGPKWSKWSKKVSNDPKLSKMVKNGQNSKEKCQNYQK